MASVWLKRRGWEDGDLPDVCMYCGGDAPDRVKKTFTWTPSWVYLLILVNLIVLIVVALLVQQKRRTRLPLCAEHKYHWGRRNWFAFGCFIVLTVANVIFGTAAAYLMNSDDAVGIIILVGGLSMLVCVIVIAIVHNGAIRVLKIEKNSIHLTNVCQEFKDAYEDELDRREEARYADKDLIDRTVRERWNQGSRRPISDETRNKVREETPGEDDRPSSDKYRPE